MPYYLSKGSSQHSTEEANLSRLVTKVRWVVESANGRIKHWKLLDKVISNHYVSSVGDFVRIVCSLCNHFRPPLANHDPEGENIAKEMLQRSKLENHFKLIVEETIYLDEKVVTKILMRKMKTSTISPIISGPSSPTNTWRLSVKTGTLLHS